MMEKMINAATDTEMTMEDAISSVENVGLSLSLPRKLFFGTRAVERDRAKVDNVWEYSVFRPSISWIFLVSSESDTR